MSFYTLLAAVLLAVVHLFAYRLQLHFIPRSKWLSFAGGISVTYVFIHLLPELAAWQNEAGLKNLIGFLNHHLYLVALLGMSFFYGLERAAKLSVSSARTEDKGGSDFAHSNRIFWLHLLSFCLYNVLIGYLLVHRDVESRLSLLLYTLAMAFHFLVNDYALADHYRRDYHSKGRWLASFSVLLGWGLGLLTNLSETTLAILFAWLAGGIMLNVLKEELPEERKSNFWAFLLGVFAYSVLLLTIAE
jgi:zinc transporter ZupT